MAQRTHNDHEECKKLRPCSLQGPVQPLASVPPVRVVGSCKLLPPALDASVGKRFRDLAPEQRDGHNHNGNCRGFIMLTPKSLS